MMAKKRKTHNDDGLIYADEVNYWKTSTSSVESWQAKIRKLLEEAGADIFTEGMMKNKQGAGFLFEFVIDGDPFRIQEVVLPPRKSDEFNASVRQAVTRVYYRVKTLLMDAQIYGAKHALVQYLVDPETNRTVQERVMAGHGHQLPASMFAPPSNQLGAGGVIDGDYEEVE